MDNTSPNEDIDPPAWLDREIFPFRLRRIRVLDHEIHYVDEGSHDKPTLLLLHGNGSWSYGFRLAIPRLSTQYRVIAPDYPGFGLSKAAAGYSFKPRDQSEVIEAFVTALNLQDIRLFVEDWGGPIGLGFAGRRPELIHSLIITNTWAWPAQGSPQLERFSNLAGGFLGRFLITRFNLLERVALPRINIARKMSPTEHQGYYMPYPTAESRLPQTIFPREILASHEYLSEVEGGLAKLASKPVLIIWGESDPGFSATERNRFINDHFNHAKVVLLREAIHFVLVDEPEKSMNAILDFEKGGR